MISPSKPTPSRGPAPGTIRKVSTEQTHRSIHVEKAAQASKQMRQTLESVRTNLQTTHRALEGPVGGVAAPVPTDWAFARPNQTLFKTVVRSKSPVDPETLAVETVPQAVRGLTKKVVTVQSSTGYSGMTQMWMGRKQRHDEEFTNFLTALKQLAEEKTAEVADAIQQMQLIMSASDSQIDGLFQAISDRVVALEYVSAVMDEATAVRQQHIVNLSYQLEQLERSRKDTADALIRDIALKLVDIALKLPTEIAEILAAETKTVNESIAANRAAYAQLIANLRIAEEIRHKDVLKRASELSRKLKCDDFATLTESSRRTLLSDELVYPVPLREALYMITQQQTQSIRDRVDNINALVSLFPPFLTPSAVQSANENIERSLNRAEQALERGVALAKEETATSIVERDTFLKLVRKDLEALDVADAHVISATFDAQLHPLNAKIRSQTTAMCDKIAIALAAQRKQIRSSLNRLETFYKICAEMHLQSEVDNTAHDEATFNALAQRRAQHDATIVQLEANLTAQVERVRQAHDSKLIAAELSAAHAILKEMDDEYRKFHDESYALCQAHVSNLKINRETFAAALATHLGVIREDPFAVPMAPVVVAPVDTKKPAAKPDTKKPAAVVAPPVEEIPIVLPTDDDSNWIKSPLGVWYKVLKANLCADGTAVVSAEELIIPRDPFDKPCILADAVPPAMLKQFCVQLRRSLLFIVEERTKELVEKAEQWCAVQRESFAVELEQRLRELRPRAGRLEVDVADKRASELAARARKAERHIQAITQRSKDAARVTAKRVTELETTLAQYMAQQTAFEQNAVSASSAEAIKLIIKQSAALRDSFVVYMKEQYGQLQQAAQNARDIAEQAHVGFQSNFGAETAEETTRLQGILDRSRAILDQDLKFELKAHAESLSKVEEQATAASNKVEALAKPHLLELVFVEAVRAKTTIHNSLVIEEGSSKNAEGNIERLLSQLEFLTSEEPVPRKTLADEGFVINNTVEEPNTLFGKIVRVMRELRFVLHRRATQLQCFKSPPITLSDIPLMDDPAADPFVGSEPVTVFMDKVNLLVQKQRTMQTAESEKFYKEKGDRPIARPQVLEATLVEYKQKMEEMLSGVQAKAAAHIKQALAAFRSQVARLMQLLPSVPATVFTSHILTMLAIRDNVIVPIIEAYDMKRAESTAEQHRNFDKLKPSLSGPLGTSTLQEIVQQEHERWVKATEAVKENANNLLSTEGDLADKFGNSLVTLSTTMCKLLDQTVMPPHLTSPEEPVEGKHRSIKSLMKDRARLEALGAPTTTPTPSPTLAQRSYPGIKLKEFSYYTVLGLAPPVTTPVVAPPPVAPAKAGKPAAKVPEKKGAKESILVPETDGASPDIVCNDTLPHLATIQARDKAAAEYLRQFRPAVRKYKVEEESRLADDHRWKEQWDSAVAQLKDW